MRPRPSAFEAASEQGLWGFGMSSCRLQASWSGLYGRRALNLKARNLGMDKGLGGAWLRVLSGCALELARPGSRGEVARLATSSGTIMPHCTAFNCVSAAGSHFDQICLFGHDPSPFEPRRWVR